MFGFLSLITLGGGRIQVGALNVELEERGSTASLAAYQLWEGGKASLVLCFFGSLFLYLENGTVVRVRYSNE